MIRCRRERQRENILISAQQHETALPLFSIASWMEKWGEGDKEMEKKPQPQIKRMVVKIEGL